MSEKTEGTKIYTSVDKCQRKPKGQKYIPL